MAVLSRGTPPPRVLPALTKVLTPLFPSSGHALTSSTSGPILGAECVAGHQVAAVRGEGRTQATLSSPSGLGLISPPESASFCDSVFEGQPPSYPLGAVSVPPARTVMGIARMQRLCPRGDGGMVSPVDTQVLVGGGGGPV